jgi:hypothetical protein
VCLAVLSTLALRWTGSLGWLFAALAPGLFLHGTIVLVAIGSHGGEARTRSLI